MDITTHTAETAAGPARRLGWWQAGGLALLVATAANLVILAIGTAADASFVVVDGGEPADVGAGVVVGATAIPLVLGFLVAALVGRWRPGLVRPLAMVAAVFAVVSMAGPFAADTDTGTAAALAVMHLVVGAAFLGSTEAARTAA
jgi:hypothetical protein